MSQMFRWNWPKNTIVELKAALFAGQLLCVPCSSSATSLDIPPIKTGSQTELKTPTAPAMRNVKSVRSASGKP